MLSTLAGMSSVTSPHAGPPTPEELQRRFQEMFRQMFPGGAPGFTQAQPGEPKAEEPPAEPFDLERFRLKPREVKAHLDRFVIRQDEAKKVLSVALCDHYNAVRLAHEGKALPNYAKQNVILLGPTGVGKTYLIRSVAELIGVPFVRADATKFSETGYVGGDVEDLVRDLVRKAGGDISRAQFGIIYVDEIDKIAAASNVAGRDVSGRGVQTNLLKLMEETEVPARAPNDIAGQMEAMMSATRGGKRQPATINTRHILFIVSGAFPGLEKLVEKRLSESVMGFGAKPSVLPEGDHSLSHAGTRDFVEFGFEPEFIGRLPVRVVCHPLDQDDLFAILKSSEGSIVRQVEQAFGAYGIEVLFHDDGLRRIAARAAAEKTGARGLLTVCEGVFRELKFELPSLAVPRFEVTAALVDDPAAALRGLAEARVDEERQTRRQIVHEFGARFRQSHGLELRFTDAAADALVAAAETAGRPVRELCGERFKDFEFGLKLVAQNTGQTSFTLDAPDVERAQQVLSEWVVASYRGAADASVA